MGNRREVRDVELKNRDGLRTGSKGLLVHSIGVRRCCSTETGPTGDGRSKQAHGPSPPHGFQIISAVGMLSDAGV